MFMTPIDTSALDYGATTTAKTAQDGTDPAAMQDRFLKLLVAQLNNQDPMNPLDNAQMTTQMAQINTVTGLQQLNLSMQGMVEEFSTMQQIQGISLIGRSVLTEGNRMAWNEAKAQGIFDLSAPAQDVQVDIVTPGGVLVDTVKLGALDKGRAHFEWDGSSYSGNQSDLRYQIRATNGESAVASTALQQSDVVATGSSAGALTLTLANGDVVNYFRVYGVL